MARDRLPEHPPRAVPVRLTVDEVYALTAAGMFADDDAFELIEGEIVPMAAAKCNHHEAMKSRLNEALVLAKPRSAAVFVEASVTLSQDTLLEPDLAIWPRHRHAGRSRPQSAARGRGGGLVDRL